MLETWRRVWDIIELNPEIKVKEVFTRGVNLIYKRVKSGTKEII